MEYNTGVMGHIMKDYGMLICLLVKESIEKQMVTSMKDVGYTG